VPAVVSDTLETRLELAGLSAYVQGLTQAAGAVGLLDDNLSKVAKQRLGLGIAALAGSAGIFAGLGRATFAAAEEQEQYNRAVRNFKGSLPLADLQQLTGELSALTGVDDGKIANVAGILGTFNVAGGDAKQLIEPILNVEVALRALGITSEQISTQVGKALQTGDAGPLRRSGIVIEDTGFKSASAAQRVQMLIKALNAQGGATAAREFRKELPGAVQAWETALGNLQEGVGAAFVQPLTGAVNLATDLVNTINGLDEEQLQAIGYGAAAVAFGLGAAGIAATISAVRLGKLAAENVVLQNEQLKAKKSTDLEAAAVEEEAKAHEHAARAVKRHADAEKTLHGGKRPGGAVQLPGTGAGSDEVPLPGSTGSTGKPNTPRKTPSPTSRRRFRLPRLGRWGGPAAATAATLGLEWWMSQQGNDEPEAVAADPEAMAEETTPAAEPRYRSRGMAGDVGAYAGEVLKITLRKNAMRTAEGASWGGMFGAPGAVVGGALGLGVSAVENLRDLNTGKTRKQARANLGMPETGDPWVPQPKTPATSPEVNTMAAAEELLREIRDELKKRKGGYVPYEDVPRSEQARARYQNLRM
jgi:hypothetical protein